MKLHKDRALGKRTKKGIVWGFMREGFAELIAFPVSMVQARLLSPEEFGIAAAAGFFTLLAGRLSELGFNAAIIRAKEVKPIHLSTVFIMNLLMGVLSFAVLTAMAPLVAAFYHEPNTSRILPIAALSFLIAPLGAVPAGLLSRHMKYKEGTTVSWAQSLAFSGTSVVLAWMGFSYMSLVYGRLAGVVAQTALRIYFARWKPSLNFSWAAVKEILPYGIGAHAKRLLDYTAQQGDNLVVGRTLGMEALGLYDKAYSTMNRFFARMSVGPGLTFRVFSIIHEEPERFKRAYQKVTLAATLTAFPVFGLLIAVAPQLILVLFGRKWTASVVPFQFLCLAGCLKLMNLYASSATQAAGWIWSEVWRQIVLIVCTVGGILLLGRWGPSGAAAGVFLATAVMSVLMHVLLTRVTSLGWRDILEPMVPPVGCAVGVGLVALTVERGLILSGLHVNPLILLVVQTAVAGLFALAFVLGVPHGQMRALVKELASDVMPGPLKRQRWVQGYLAGPS